MRIEEESFRQIASIYLREYSNELRQEIEGLQQVQAAETPFLDRRVRDKIALIKRARRRKWISGMAAACLVVALITPAMWRMVGSGQTTPPVYETLQLSFAMPGRFTVASVEQDFQKTIYALDDKMLDPVVMTMEQNADTVFLNSLTPLIIDGYTVYGQSGGGYQLMAFEKQEILYTLTCRYDINTLADLSRGILA